MEKTEHKIIDNFLSMEDFKNLENLMTRNKNFPWYYTPDMTFENVESPHTMYFTHSFYDAFTIQSNCFTQ